MTLRSLTTLVPPPSALSVLVLLLPLALLAGCGGGDELDEDPGAVHAAEELDTGYDASGILERLTDKETHADPELLAALAADLNELADSRDFYTARRQARELSVDFKNRPMRASMAAALMDLWNQDPPAEVTVADLEQAWAIRRVEKKTPEQLAAEAEAQYQDRRAKQEEVVARREQVEVQKEEQKKDVVGDWVAAYRKGTAEATDAAERVALALTDTAHGDDLGAACQDLYRATQSMDGRLFRAPDPAVNGPLFNAWEAYRGAARSCIKGEHAYLTTKMREAQLAMRQVNEILAPYGHSL